MKTRNWLLIFGILALLCVLALFLLKRPPAAMAEVYSDGELLYTLDLGKDGTYRVCHADDWNLLVVEDGKIRVESASCAGQDCVHRGAANSGPPLVCLPNRLVIEFIGENELDAMLG